MDRVFVSSFLAATALTLMAIFIQGCTIRTYKVTVYACEDSAVDISPEILAEVPHTTTVQTEAELDMPDANVIGQ
jgi:hypothetical protein